MISTLAKLSMRVLKNPCDGSFANKLGNIYPYCYLLQYAYKMSIAINKDQCCCDILKTCESKTGSCKNIKSKNMHVFNCSRTLCNPCQLFRRYNFICYKMVFTKEPMAFQIYIKKLLKLVESSKIATDAKNVIQTKHCYHSNEYQDHKKCVIFEPYIFMLYEYDITKNLTDNQKDIILQLCLEEIPEQVDQNNIHVKELINNMYKNLENAYHYKVATMEKNGLVNLNCNNLINLNNIITSGSYIMLRQKQMLSWLPSKK